MRGFVKKTVLQALALFICFQTAVFPAMAEEKAEEPKLYAQSAVLMDGDTGRVLYEKNGDAVRPMASTTKIMTCILALEYGNPEDVVTVSSYAAGQPRVHLGAAAGRRFYLRDLLYSLMLESHNDTAVMIAEHVGGSAAGFADLMNEKAAELGCKDTWFITPNGLDSAEHPDGGEEKVHSTTARDLAAIMKYCVWESPKRQEFLDITRAQNHYFTDAEGKGGYSCVNHNALLSSMKNLLSGKTGFTGGAGYCYVAALEDGGRKYVIALLGCGWPPHKSWKWSDAGKLFSYGLDRYQKKQVFQEPVLPSITVEDGIPSDGNLERTAEAGTTLNLKESEKSLEILMKEGEQAEIQTEIPDAVQAPLRKGTEVGRISYLVDGVVIRTYPVYAAETIEKLTPGWCMKKILKAFLR